MHKTSLAHLFVKQIKDFNTVIMCLACVSSKFCDGYLFALQYPLSGGYETPSNVVLCHVLNHYLFLPLYLHLVCCLNNFLILELVVCSVKHTMA